MLIILSAGRFKSAIAAVLKDAMENVNDSLRGIRSVADLSERVKTLRQQCETLEVEKGRKEEEFERKEREIEHKVGLERKRQEFEVAAAKRETTVAIREENLAADRKRFEEQMKFHEDRFTQEVGYLKDMLAEMMKRLPSAEFTADLTPSKRR